MEDTYNSDYDEEDNDLFMKHVIGDDKALLHISRYLDKVYTDDDDF